MITSMIILIAMIMIPINIFLLMANRPDLARRFNSWVVARVRNIVRGILQWLGRQVADFAGRNPLAVGVCVIVFLIVLYLFLGGHLR